MYFNEHKLLTFLPNFIWKQLFWTELASFSKNVTDVRTYGRTDGRTDSICFKDYSTQSIVNYYNIPDVLIQYHYICNYLHNVVPLSLWKDKIVKILANLANFQSKIIPYLLNKMPQSCYSFQNYKIITFHCKKII